MRRLAALLAVAMVAVLAVTGMAQARRHHRHHPRQPPAPTATPSPTATPAVTPTVTPTGDTRNVEVTFYGAYDNDPPGSTDIAHPVLHQGAGGTGTYADPLTFASPAGSGAYPWGTRIYVPGVRKYFIREDECAVSWTAPNGCGQVSHVDLYVGNPSTSRAVVQCEESLTLDDPEPIVVNPATNLTVNNQKLWDQASGACYQR